MPTGIYIRKNKKIYPTNCSDCLIKIGNKNRTGLCLSCAHKRNPTRYWLGKKRPDIAERKRGEIISEETRKKLVKSHTGKIGYWKGKKRPDIKEMWKNHINKTDESKIWRTRIEYRLWREAVFARDNWTCQKYGIKGGILHPHHIQNFAEYPELRFVIDNGITFLKKTHMDFHKIYGVKNNTKGQLEEFLRNGK